MCCTVLHMFITLLADQLRRATYRAPLLAAAVLVILAPSVYANTAWWMHL